MTRPLPHRNVPTLAAAALMTVLAPSGEALATPFWFGWAGHDRPVIYRPIVTPRTYYFAPAGAVEVVPARHHGHRHGRHHHRQAR
ncbi:hypothetical protein ACJ4V0_05375 [Phreatobacter sp. HK31-P]